MSNLLVIKKDFFSLLANYIHNKVDNKYFQYKQFILTLHKQQDLNFNIEDSVFYLNQNIKVPFMVIVDPFFLYEKLDNNDENAIKLLFKKILNSVNLNSKNCYFTYSLKGKLNKPTTENKEKHLKYLQKELEIIKPKVVIGFGQYTSELLFNQACELNSSKEYFFSDHPFLFCSHPIDVFYNEKNKKPLWDFLRNIQQNYL